VTKWDLMGFYGDLMGSFMGFTGIYPLAICYIAIENSPFGWLIYRA